MPQQPVLETARLLLRPFRGEDAPEVQRLAGAFHIACTTLRIPHPYPDGAAEAWIASHPEQFERGEECAFAVTDRSDGRLLGCVGLELCLPHLRAELGYWITKAFWGRGYCTEAVAAVLGYGFEAWNLNRIQAQHFSRNPASGRVMQKLGMSHEGRLRQHLRKWDVFEDVEIYAILHCEWTARGTH